MKLAGKTVPPAMAESLRGLTQTLAELAPATPAAPAACPIFGDAPAPAATAPAGLPPLLAAAGQQLARSIASPPSLGNQWPFADPPRLREARERGRPATVKPHQVVRLARFVKLGDSVRFAATKAGLPESTARRVLSGQHSVAHHPAVTAAGVHLPPARPRSGAPKTAPRPQIAPLGASPSEGGVSSTPAASGGPEAPVSESVSA